MLRGGEQKMTNKQIGLHWTVDGWTPIMNEYCNIKWLNGLFTCGILACKREREGPVYFPFFFFYISISLNSTAILLAIITRRSNLHAFIREIVYTEFLR